MLATVGLYAYNGKKDITIEEFRGEYEQCKAIQEEWEKELYFNNGYIEYTAITNIEY